MTKVLRILLPLLVMGLAAPLSAAPSSVQVTWRLLDYIAVDYAGAVGHGEIIDAAEYQEMVEFAGAAQQSIRQLPDHAGKAELERRVQELKQAIAERREPTVVARISRELGSKLLTNYPVPLAPASPPDFGRGAALYAEQCATCHGAAGDGTGPAAAGLDPPPIDFTDPIRARERSVFALYQVIEQGLEGTSMPSFSGLAAPDKWALALYVGSFGFPAELAPSGEKIWKGDAALRQSVILEKLITVTPNNLLPTSPLQASDALNAFLRRNPQAVMASASSGLNIARDRLAEAEAAYKRGAQDQARDLALSAYLDGFESVEPTLAVRDAKLLAGVERAMAALRTDISNFAPAERVSADVRELHSLLARADATLREKNSSAASSFFGSLTILLREGLEALLLVVSMIAFLRKSERQDALRHVHAGWIAALAAGVATWALATSIISISGASREITEGMGSIFAALVLLWVGIWMHGKSQADAWQKYIRTHMSRAMSRGSAWFLFGLSFLVVYREVFETILFYAALWEQGNVNAILGGAAVALGLLAAIAFAMLRLSQKLPIGKFFSYSSVLIAVLAVVLIGKGIAALQEAGMISVGVLPGFPRIELLGITPTIQAVSAQLVMFGLLALGFWWSRRETSAP